MIAILTAMHKENYLVSKDLVESYDLGDYRIGRFHGRQALVANTGVGKVNAAITLMNILSSAKIEKVYSIGCAGALVPTLKVGDIVIGNSYCYHDVWCGEPNMNGQVQGYPSVFPSSFADCVGRCKCTYGTIATGDWFVTTKEKADRIINYVPSKFNVIAVDMESAALAHTCYRKNIPFVSIRVISDNPVLPNQMKQYDGFWDDMAHTSFNALTSIIG